MERNNSFYNENGKQEIKLNETLDTFFEEIKNQNKFEDKIEKLFLSECEEKLTNILRIRESEFLQNVSVGVRMTLEDTYGPRVFEEKIMKDIFRKYERSAKKNFYYPHFKIISSAWNEYETHLQAIKRSSKLSSKNNDNFSFLRHFRKHCSHTDPIAYHNCSPNAKLLEIWDDDDTDDSNINYVVCIECKRTYFYDCILLNCAPCKKEYYSSTIPKNENIDIQPATWSKYHCGALINDKMKCIKCREVFYLDLKSNMLVCLKCNFKVKPLSIAWSCQICKKEFKCQPKIYNPLEFKFIKDTIKQVLLIKQRARPANVPCCKMNIISETFFHKRECHGEVFQGELDGKLIVVCEKCKSMNFYDKYIWTCPKCFKRFKVKRQPTRKETLEEDDGNNHEYNQKLIEENNYTPQKLRPEILNENSSKVKTPLVSPYKPNLGSSAKHKSLHEILDERKRKGSSEIGLMKKLDETDQGEIESGKGKFGMILEEEMEKEEMKKELNVNQVNQINQINKKDNQIKDDNRIKNNFLITNDDHKKIPKKSLPRSPVLDDRNNYSSDYKGLESIEENKTPVKHYKKSMQIITIECEPNSPSKLRKSLSSSSNNTNCLTPSKIREINVDDYKIIKQIGEGSYGKIYLVEDKNKKQFAMKKLIAHDLDDVKFFKNEFELVNAAQHKNIMKIFGTTNKLLDSTTYAVYIIMEKANYDWDEEIKNRCKNKNPYTEEELIKILKSLVAGLIYLQNLNISHRDLKPQNILLFDNDIYKVADFGEAKECKIAKQMNTLRGTELYMAPILLDACKKNVDDVTHNTYKSDVFSLGYCLIYAATLTFTPLNQIRDLRNMRLITDVLNTYLKMKYSQKMITLISKMIDVSEYLRFDFIGLDKYLQENFP